MMKQGLILSSFASLLGFVTCVSVVSAESNYHQCYVCQDFELPEICMQNRNIRTCQGLENNEVECDPDKTSCTKRCCCEGKLCNENLTSACGIPKSQEPTTTTPGPAATPKKPIATSTRTVATTTPKIIPCHGQMPIPPINGKIRFIQNKRINGREMPQAIAFACNEGFCINGSKITNCTNGNWSSPTPRCEREVCTRKQDIILVIDKSSSIGNVNFQNGISFLKKLVTKFRSNKKDASFCIVTFGSDAENETAGFENDAKKLESAIEKMKYPDYNKKIEGIRGTTCTGSGLEKAYNVCIVDDGKRENSSGQLWLITDGMVSCKSKNITANQVLMANNLRNEFEGKGFELFAMAVSIKEDESDKYLTEWSRNQLVKTTWSDMTKEAVNHVNEICKCP